MHLQGGIIIPTLFPRAKINAAKSFRFPDTLHQGVPAKDVIQFVVS